MKGGYLAELVPALGKYRLPFSRDQAMLLMAALNEIFLGLDIFFAHSISLTITPREWIPIIFGPAAGLVLLLAGWLARRNRPLATYLATAVFVLSIVVGLVGAYFHVVRAILPYASPGQRVSLDLLVWAPPILGPLTFALVGILGISAAWVEDPVDSGVLDLGGGRKLRLPYSKTRAYVFMAGLGMLATLISSVLDHARTPFQNPWLWLPTLVGIFASVAAVTFGALERPSKADVQVYAAAMLAAIAVGIIGFGLHVREDLTPWLTIVPERFLRGAPFMAPLLFADMGTIGLLVLLDPREEIEAKD
jgi:hypothetical protein